MLGDISGLESHLDQLPRYLATTQSLCLSQLQEPDGDLSVVNYECKVLGHIMREYRPEDPHNPKQTSSFSTTLIWPQL